MTSLIANMTIELTDTQREVLAAAERLDRFIEWQDGGPGNPICKRGIPRNDKAQDAAREFVEAVRHMRNAGEGVL